MLALLGYYVVDLGLKLDDGQIHDFFSKLIIRDTDIINFNFSVQTLYIALHNIKKPPFCQPDKHRSILDILISQWAGGLAKTVLTLLKAGQT